MRERSAVFKLTVARSVPQHLADTLALASTHRWDAKEMHSWDATNKRTPFMHAHTALACTYA